MKVSSVIETMECIAPLRFAEDWDNVGLLVGGREWQAKRILLTIDLTPAVLEEAILKKINCIIAYHPPIFSPLKAITDDSWGSRLILDAAVHRIAIYSPHTALDAVPGGVNDWLASGLGSGEIRALAPAADLPRTEQYKIVTFCPPAALNKIRNAVARAGAGRIGDYSSCSFSAPGTGSFHGGESTHPAVGKKGRVEEVEEIRLEMVVPSPEHGLAEIVAALKNAHPYEEPAFEIHALQPRPLRDTGMGRIIVPDSPLRLDKLISCLKDHLGVDGLRVASAKAKSHLYRRIGVCAGAGGSMLESVLGEGCDLFFTGEMRYHEVLDANARGCTIILAGHSNTERGYLKILRRTLKKHLSGADIYISRKDAYPLQLT